MKAPNLAKLTRRCLLWNTGHPIGCEVWYHPVIGEPGCAKYKTRTKATVLSGHTCVVWLDGKSGCVALDALTDSPFDAGLKQERRAA